MAGASPLRRLRQRPGASGRREPKGHLRTGKGVTAPSPCCELRRRKEAEQRPGPGAAFAPRPSANAAAGWSFRAAGRGLRRGEGGGRSPGPWAPGAEQVPAESVPFRGGARVARIRPLASLPGRAQAGASLCTYPARHPQGLPGVALMSFAPGPPRGPSVCSAGTRPPGLRSRLLRAGASGLLAPPSSLLFLPHGFRGFRVGPAAFLGNVLSDTSFHLLSCVALPVSLRFRSLCFEVYFVFRSSISFFLTNVLFQW